MQSKQIVSILRRDAMFVGNALVAIVFIGFAGLAVGATVIDLLAIIPN